VREVRNLLQVVPSNAKDRAQVSDEQLKERIAAALKKDRVLEDSDIQVQSVNSGVVLLGGKAGCADRRLRGGRGGLAGRLA
jgi:osmotically-inducible protein OsmY